MRRSVIAVAAALAATAAAAVAGAVRARSGAPEPATIEVSGTIEATEVSLRVQAGGEVRRVPFEEGATVTAGALVCELDRDKLEQELAAADARLAEAGARLLALRNGARPEERERARARVAVEEAILRDAERELRMQRQLGTKGIASTDALERADNAVRTARARLEVARSTLDLVQAGARGEDIAAAEAAVAGAASQVALCRLRLADLRTLSPIEGRVLERFVEPGEVVPAGALVATVADLTRLRVKVYVGERDLGHVRLGTAALVHVDAYPGRAFPGRVTRLASRAEFTPRSLQTKEDRVKLVYETTVDVANTDGALLPGMPCDVRLVRAEGP